MCDCSTDLGEALRIDSTLRPPDRARETKKLQKKGWGAAKIERCLTERQIEFERRRAEAEKRKERPHDAQRWCDFIHAALEAGAARSIGILLHFYSGGLDSERIRIGGRRILPASELTARSLSELEEDVLYEFNSSRRHTVRPR